MQNEEITHKIIGCAMKVHSVLGKGYKEVIYQRAFAIELKKQGLTFKRELETPIYYDGIIIGIVRVDFLIEGILTELKAVSEMDGDNLRQALNYCEVHDKPIALLLNFGSKSLEFKRIYNHKHIENSGFKKGI